MIQKTFMKYLALLILVVFLMPSLGVAGMNDEDPSCCYKFAQNFVRGLAILASAQGLAPPQTQGSYGIVRQSHFGEYERIPRSYALYGPKSPVGFNTRDSIQDAFGGELMEGIDVCTRYSSDLLCTHPNRTLCMIYHPNLVRNKQEEAGGACEKIAGRSYSRLHDEDLGNFVHSIHDPLCQMIRTYPDPEDVLCHTALVSGIKDPETQGLFERLRINTTNVLYAWLYPVREDPRTYDPLAHLKKD